MRTIKSRPHAVNGQKETKNGQAPQLRIEMLPINHIEPTPDNRRRPITNASVESLAKSLKHSGILQPVIVRPHPERKGRFELRAGERRWRAAKVAGFTHIPASVRELTDQSALSVTIAENVEREDLHPLEEAETFQVAFKRGLDIKALAAELGRSEQYVARRASLTRLIKAWKAEILRPNSEAGRLSVAHLELIARLPPATQELLSERNFEIVFGRSFPSVDELRRIIDGGMHSLKAMPWRVDDDTLDPKVGACLNCSKRSSRDPLLFLEEGDTVPESSSNRIPKGDRCLDPLCYQSKHTAHLLRCESTHRESHPKLQVVQVTYERLAPSTHKAFADRMSRASQPELKESKGKSSIPVMPIDGPKAGQLLYVTAPPSTNGHATGKGNKADKGKNRPATATERKARLERRRDAYLVKHIEGVLKGLTDDDLAKVARRLESTNRPKDQLSVDYLALVLAFGTSTRNDRCSDADAWPDYERLRSRSGTVRAIKVLRELVPIWARRLARVDGSTAAAQAADAKRICKVVGLDTAAIEAKAVKVIPIPKNWTSK